jgi:FAD-dependent urate hydroxylase
MSLPQRSETKPKHRTRSAGSRSKIGAAATPAAMSIVYALRIEAASNEKATLGEVSAPRRDPMTPPIVDGLDRLAARVRHELELLEYPKRAWLPARRTAAGEPVYDVVIVGAGQGGLAAAFGLMRERVTNLMVVDENPLDRAGPWLNFARMHTLRTPKHVIGPDLGVPSLTPRAWYEAQHGEGSWENLGLIPKEAWAAYLAWYRRTLGIPVRPDTRVGALEWDALESAWRIPCDRQDGAQSHAPGEAARTRAPGDLLYARRVVLATGIEGSGQWHVPAMIRALPSHLYAHTRADIDFDALRGKRVAVLGAGASSFDNASTALERGASEVRLFFRRAELVKVNSYRWAEFVGFLHHFGDLGDDDKWRFILQILRMGQLPPADTYRRATQNPGFHLHPGTGWKGLEARGDTVRITTDQGVAAQGGASTVAAQGGASTVAAQGGASTVAAQGGASTVAAQGGASTVASQGGASTIDCDFVIAGTGFVTDLSVRPELRHIEQHIARWADRYTPPEDERQEDLLRHPYLGPGFEFTEREPGKAPYLGTLHNYTFGCLLSLGFGGASISGMKYSIPRLVSGLTRSLFLEDRGAHYESLCRFGEREF